MGIEVANTVAVVYKVLHSISIVRALQHKCSHATAADKSRAYLTTVTTIFV